MKKILPLLIIALFITGLARADEGGRIAAGIIGGAMAGALAAESGYPVYPPPPVYGPPVYSPPVYVAPQYATPVYQQQDPVAVEEAAHMREQRLERARQKREQTRKQRDAQQQQAK